MRADRTRMRLTFGNIGLDFILVKYMVPHTSTEGPYAAEKMSRSLESAPRQHLTWMTPAFLHYDVSYIAHFFFQIWIGSAYDLSRKYR